MPSGTDCQALPLRQAARKQWTRHSAVQPARELSAQVLLLPHSIMAAVALRGGGLRWRNRRLCACKNVRWLAGWTARYPCKWSIVHGCLLARAWCTDCVDSARGTSAACKQHANCVRAANRRWPFRDEKKSDTQFGHVTSLAVARTHRKLGIASKLMRAARAPQPCPPTAAVLDSRALQLACRLL